MQKPRESIYKRYVPAVSAEGEIHEQAYWFIFRANLLLIKVEGDQSRIPYLKTVELELSPVRTHYLGTLFGEPCYSAEVAGDTENPVGMAFKDLWSLYDDLDEDLYTLAGRALQILQWDQTHQFCGRCGTKTVTSETERAKVCPQCGLIRYTRISPAVITAVIKGDQILLASGRKLPVKFYSLIAGFVEPGETLEECVSREIMEEVGIKVKNIRYFSSQPWPFPDSLMVGFIADYDSGEIMADGVEIIEAGWYNVHNLPNIPPKLSIARRIIDWYIENYPGLGNSKDTQ